MIAQITNNNCDGQGSGNCTSHNSEVRVLPLGGGANLIICRAHYRKEIYFREDRNKSLGDYAKFELPEWHTLEVYTGV